MKTSRRSVLLLVALGVSITACNPAHPAQQAVKDINKGNAAACTEERAIIEKAVEAYTLLNPDSPVTEAAMVSGGFLREQSVLMNVTATGAVVPAPGTVCT